MNGRGERSKLHGCDFCGSHSCDVVLRKKSPFLHRGTLGRKNGGNCCTQCIGIDRQLAMRALYALPHSSDSEADSSRLNFRQPVSRNSHTVILNLRVNLVELTSDADYRSFAFRMAMDVSQAFLHETEYGEFYLGGKPFEIVGNINLYAEVAALRQTFYVPPKRRRQA